MILPDLLQSDLDVVFCGTAAGDKSAERKAYYAGKGNLFYPTLYTCGFTPLLYKPEQYTELVKHRVGLTDLAKHTHGMDYKLKPDDYDTGAFETKMLLHKPGIVCFNGKEAAKVYFGYRKTADVKYGLQETTIGSTKLFVAPSTSITAFAYWDENYWQELKKMIQTI